VAGEAIDFIPTASPAPLIGLGEREGGNSLLAGNFLRLAPTPAEFACFKQWLGEHFPVRQTGKAADPNRECLPPNREITGGHRRASLRVNEGAVCHAIAAIFAAFATSGGTPFFP
jgi:hypothetical protein